jgi:hypothetical protein
VQNNLNENELKCNLMLRFIELYGYHFDNDNKHYVVMGKFSNDNFNILKEPSLELLENNIALIYINKVVYLLLTNAFQPFRKLIKNDEFVLIKPSGKLLDAIKQALKERKLMKQEIEGNSIVLDNKIKLLNAQHGIEKDKELNKSNLLVSLAIITQLKNTSNNILTEAEQYDKTLKAKVHDNEELKKDIKKLNELSKDVEESTNSISKLRSEIEETDSILTHIKNEIQLYKNDVIDGYEFFPHIETSNISNGENKKKIEYCISCKTNCPDILFKKCKHKCYCSNCIENFKVEEKIVETKQQSKKKNSKLLEPLYRCPCNKESPIAKVLLI